MSKLRVLDLFSGIGGFSLGLERAGGFETVAFCEIEDYPRRVLAKHWPGVRIYEDVRTLTADALARDGITVDIICGGFPCQDISVAGRGAGLAGERSGLWSEYARLIGELRPAYVIVENVAALLSRGLGTVLGDLSSLGFDAEWHCIPAAAVGAPHRRDRVWIVAHPGYGEGAQPSPRSGGEARLNALRQRDWQEGAGAVGNGGSVLAKPTQELFDGGGATQSDQGAEHPNGRCDVADADTGNEHGRRGALQMGWGRLASEAIENGDARGTEWGSEPDVGRVANGVPARVDRLKGLGNAVVPQIPEMIGRAIMGAIA